MKTYSQIKEDILSKVGNDGDFRALLLEDPKAAIKEASGILIPDGINIYVVEDATADYHLVLPPAGRNLSDQEIGDVAGGCSFFCDGW